MAAFCLIAAVWSKAADLPPVDSKVMQRGYFFVGSRMDPKALGGYATYTNLPKKALPATPGAAGRLSLIALPDQTTAFGTNRGFRLLLINRTLKEAVFDASDSRLAVVCEALDDQGAWRPIEYLPSSWCGNSYHRVFLPAGHYWDVAAPQYAGSFRTKLRFVLTGKERVVSNEFEGAINVEQFSAKQGHTPAALMDPYHD